MPPATHSKSVFRLCVSKSVKLGISQTFTLCLKILKVTSGSTHQVGVKVNELYKSVNTNGVIIEVQNILMQYLPTVYLPNYSLIQTDTNQQENNTVILLIDYIFVFVIAIN